MYQCLILNSDYSPFDIVGWRKAILMSYSTTKSAYPIEYHGHTIQDSAGRKHPLPSIMVLKKYINTAVHDNRYTKYTKYNVFTRDDMTCQYCAKVFRQTDLTIDHVIPVSRYRKLGYKGNINSLDNVVTCCYNCNIKKGNYTPDECGMHPLKKPKRITRKECLLNKIRNMTIPLEWEIYVK
jgi:5-methylcytosine-specific restriction endonuclease McrA